MKLGQGTCYSGTMEFVVETQNLKIDKVLELVNVTVNLNLQM